MLNSPGSYIGELVVAYTGNSRNDVQERGYS